MMPNLDAGNIAYQLIKIIGDALPVGPILIGPARPAHILTPSVTTRGIINMTAVAAAEAMEDAPASNAFSSADRFFDSIRAGRLIDLLTKCNFQAFESPSRNRHNDREGRSPGR